MSSKWRRFEVLLPLQFNDGRDVPPEWLTEAVLDVVDTSVRLVMRRRRSRATGGILAFFTATILCALLSMSRTQRRIAAG